MYEFSQSRYQMYLRCHREYYLHYYLALSGKCENAPEYCRLAAQLKNLKSTAILHRELLVKALDRILFAPLDETVTPVTLADLPQIVRRYYQQTANAMLQGYFLTDFNSPCLTGFYYQNAPEVLEDLQTRLLNSGKAFAQNLYWQKLTSLSPQRRKSVGRPAAVGIGDIKFYGTLYVAFAFDDHYELVDFAGEAYQNEAILSHLFLARQTWGLTPDKIRSIFVELATGQSRQVAYDQFNVSATLAQLKSKLSALPRYEAGPRVDLALSLAVADNAKCQNCRFKKWCETYQ